MANDIPKSHMRPAAHYSAYELATPPKTNFDGFIALSATLTGFSPAELAATGMSETYYEALRQVVGDPICTRLFNSGLTPAQLLDSKGFGPLARNIIRMWYLGQWKRIPSAWLAEPEIKDIKPERFDEFSRNADRVISAQAYQQGLAWRAMGVSPMGAKQPGFGSWSWAPQ